MIHYVHPTTDPALAAALAGRSCPVFTGTSSWNYFLGPTDWPNPAAPEWYLRHELADYRSIFVIDIEHTADEAHLRAAVQQYRERAGWLRIGLYGHMPTTNFWDVIAWRMSHIPEAKIRFEAWQAANRQKRVGQGSFARVVDFVCPSLYMPDVGAYATIRHWSVMARNVLAEAAQYQKPVIPYVWPFADAVPRRYVGDDVWRAMLEAVVSDKTRPEGIVYWTEPATEYPASAVEIVKRVAGVVG